MTTPGTRHDLIIAIAVGIPVLLYVMHRFFGDLIPVLLFAGTAAIVAYAGSRVHGSPISCLATHARCSPHQSSWVLGLCVVLPLAVAIAYKALRGDKRGVTGTRPVFRGR